jgi:hypothetical protein
VDAGPDALRRFEPEPPLGAVPAASAADLGPISPELALVDPELARRARELLPEPSERPRAPRPASPAPAPVFGPPTREHVAEAEAVAGRRRWPRALLLAAAIFAAGAASGTFLRTENAGSPATALEVRAGAPTTQARPASRPVVTRAALRPPQPAAKKGPTKTTTAKKRTTKTTTAKKRTTKTTAPPTQRRRHARVAWAANVLGVSAQVNRLGVELEWQRPAASSHVVVTRRRVRRGPSVVVYRGWATSYRDHSARACTAYRYTIVNYDRKGHPSTGVPTTVSTRCAGA